MPKGHHYGRTQVRPYTTEYYRLAANTFKNLVNAPLGRYEINAHFLSAEHKEFKLTELDSGLRFMDFNINGKSHQIALKLDNKSVSNKLYITCPYCQKQRQHLYVIKSAYACRQCIGLHYPCQSERPQDRLMRRIRKLRKQLWGYDWPEVNNMFENIIYWPKPKFMRWKAFEQKRHKILMLEKQYWGLAHQRLKNMFGEYYC